MSETQTIASFVNENCEPISHRIDVHPRVRLIEDLEGHAVLRVSWFEGEAFEPGLRYTRLMIGERVLIHIAPCEPLGEHGYAAEEGGVMVQPGTDVPLEGPALARAYELLEPDETRIASAVPLPESEAQARRHARLARLLGR